MQMDWKGSLTKKLGCVSKPGTEFLLRVLNRRSMIHLCSVRSEWHSLLPRAPVIFCHALLSFSPQKGPYRLLLPPAVQSWCQLTTFQIKALSTSCHCEDSNWLLSNQKAARLLLADNFTTIPVNKAFVKHVKSRENGRHCVEFLWLLSKWPLSISNVHYLDKCNKTAFL